MNPMQIKVRIISQFGNKRNFPVCEKAELFCSIARSATLTNDALNYIKQLGYTILVEKIGQVEYQEMSDNDIKPALLRSPS